MNDLVWAFALLAAIALASFRLGRRLGRDSSLPIATAVAIAAIAGLAIQVAWLADDVRIALILPTPNLIVLANAIPPLTSLLAGLAWSLVPRQADPAPHHTDGTPPPPRRPSARPTPGLVLARRLAVVLSLQAIGCAAAIRPIWGEPPSCRDRWDGDLCLQTTDTSCTAACAATLLRAHGIHATEAEMAELCLTRQGTLWLGLYRGLKLKTAGSQWDVEIIRGPFEVLRATEGPAILAAGLPRHAEVAPIYTERYGWTPGEWHSVLFFGFREGGRVAMGDPTPGIGREDWAEDDLRVLWEGFGMRLTRRPRPDGPPHRPPGADHPDPSQGRVRDRTIPG